MSVPALAHVPGQRELRWLTAFLSGNDEVADLVMGFANLMGPHFEIMT